MKKKMKHTRFASLILSLLMLFPILILPAQAASLPNLSSYKYISGFTLNTSGKLYVYTDATLSKKTGGWIDCSADECRFIGVEGNAIIVSYPTPSGRRTAYCDAAAFTKADLDADLQCVTASGKMTTFRRASGSATYGSVYKNDLVYILGWVSGRLQIVYPAGSVWKLAFVSESDASKYLGVTRSGTNTNTNTNSNTNAATNTSYSVINAATVTISSALNRSLALDVENNSFASGANLQLYTLSAGNKAQLFLVKHLNDGWHKIIHVASGNAIDVAGGVAAPMVNVWLYDASDANNAAQLFRFYKNSDGSYVIQNKLGYVLNVQNGSARKNANIWTYSNDRTASCNFFLNAVNNTSTNVTTNPNATSPKAMSTALYGSTGGYLSCGFNGYSQKNIKGYHEGIDFVKGYGSPVYSLTDGVITRVTEGSNGAAGLSTIAVYSASTGKTVIYLHTDPLNSLYVGQTISRGQKIATEAWRGVSKSSSTHTHVEVRDGRCTAAAKSVKNFVLENSNPTNFWNSQGYLVR